MSTSISRACRAHGRRLEACCDAHAIALAALAHEDVVAVKIDDQRSTCGADVAPQRFSAAEASVPTEVFVPVRRKDDED